MIQQVVQSKASHVIDAGFQSKASHVIDAGFIALIGGTLLEIIPPVTATLGLVWVCMRIYLTFLEIKEKRAAKKKKRAKKK